MKLFEELFLQLQTLVCLLNFQIRLKGLIRMEDLVDDFYYFDDINLQLIGKRTGRRFKMSDKVKIKVSAASKKENNRFSNCWYEI